MDLDPNSTLADELLAANAPQAWSSPQEMQRARSGDWPHGTIDECDDGTNKFNRVWHDGEAVWLHAGEQ